MNTSNLTLADMIVGLNNLTTDELTQLHVNLISVHKAKSRHQRLEKASEVVGKFQIGDVVRFIKDGRSSTAGTNYFIFKNMNRNGDCMQGPACDANGVPLPAGPKWTVTVTQPTLKVVMRGGKKV